MYVRFWVGFTNLPFSRPESSQRLQGYGSKCGKFQIYGKRLWDDRKVCNGFPNGTNTWASGSPY
jgi:hypothetical protein